DLGRAKDARAAYDRAAGCTEADLASIDLNRSILATRDGRGEDALAALARHDDAALRSRGDDIWVRYAWSEACALLALHRPDEARDRLERALEHEHEPEQPADLLASLAEAHLDLEDPAAATAAARRALAYERGHAHALWCIREAEGVTVQAARSFRIVVEGALPEAPEDAPGMTGFYTTYEAVGENLEDALARARGLEPDGVQASIRVSESEEFALDEPVPSGVYGMYPYHLFDPNGDDAE
ncbi:MAG: tetratricopeptide repeat protein, partial [Planctomycetota bacterium]